MYICIYRLCLFFGGTVQIEYFTGMTEIWRHKNTFQRRNTYRNVQAHSAFTGMLRAASRVRNIGEKRCKKIRKTINAHASVPTEKKNIYTCLASNNSAHNNVNNEVTNAVALKWVLTTHRKRGKRKKHFSQQSTQPLKKKGKRTQRARAKQHAIEHTWNVLTGAVINRERNLSAQYTRKYTRYRLLLFWWLKTR